jgi:hypothetical protein
MAKPPQAKGPELRARGYFTQRITGIQAADVWIPSVGAVLLLARIVLPPLAANNHENHCQRAPAS